MNKFNSCALLGLSMGLCSAAFPQAPRQVVNVSPLREAQAEPNFQNSSRFHDLMRGGNLYLSLSDALALAMENNLDIELSRYYLPVGDTELLRAKGGGLLRGLSYDILTGPAGVVSPASPVVTSAATATLAQNGVTIGTNALETGALGETIGNYSLQGEVAQSIGTPVPVFDPSIVGQLNWAHQTIPEANTVTTGTATSVTNTLIANATVQQGFGTGGQLSLGYDNTHTSLNSLRSGYSPFTSSSLGLTVSQPLVRGFGLALNRRFIEIAKNEQRITNLLFRLQVSATVYGVIRLYTDLVALHEVVNVKRESLALAEKLLADTKAQVEEGTLAPIEAARSNALVYSSRQDLSNATGLMEEQETILKTYLTKRGNEDLEVQSARIIPTDPLTIPEREEIRPLEDWIADAMADRPDLKQAKLQIVNSEIGLKGARSLVRPEVDLVGVAQNSALAGVANPLAPGANTTYSGGYGDVLSELFSRKYPTYSIGLQVTLPIRNRIAEADLARDELQLRQSQIRERQLLNQARLQVEDALIAMRRARSSYEAAVQARLLQEQSLEAEQTKFEVGASTSFFVIQYESLLAQTKSTEVAAKSAYVKARAALNYATGRILEANHVSMDGAARRRS
jgi:outer membrane protein TolC